MMQSKKFTYIECNKPGLHFGEVCNMVCVEPSCLQDLICCCACIQQSHKKHVTKPLKKIMNEAKEQSESVKPTNFNTDVLLDIMTSSQKETMETFNNCRKQITTNLDEIQKSLKGYFNSISQQVVLKNSDPKVQVANAFEAIQIAQTTEQLKNIVKKLVAMIPSKQKEKETMVLNESDLIDTLKNCNADISKMVATNIEEVNKKLKEQQVKLEQFVNKTNIWKAVSKYKFSPLFKHPEVKLLNDFHVKSTNSSGYKFAIMEPSLQRNGDIKTISFKINECSSNWIAVGICHKNIVESKNYQFNFSSLGHGGYMISANGGTWSNSQADYNNKVKAFKFAKGDIITVVVNIAEKKAIFKKKTETFEIPFSLIPGDQIYPCALFYYVNDEVEYLPDYKP